MISDARSKCLNMIVVVIVVVAGFSLPVCLPCCLPQGLLAGSNDSEQLQKGGECRDINRHDTACRRPSRRCRGLGCG